MTSNAWLELITKSGCTFVYHHIVPIPNFCCYPVWWWPFTLVWTLNNNIFSRSGQCHLYLPCAYHTMICWLPSSAPYGTSAFVALLCWKLVHYTILGFLVCCDCSLLSSNRSDACPLPSRSSRAPLSFASSHFVHTKKNGNNRGRKTYKGGTIKKPRLRGTLS